MSLVTALLLAQLASPARAVAPVLAFPQPGLDDSVAYRGYTTRFYRDAAGNTLQIYLDRREGRVVHLLADAEDASIGFSARDAQGAPAGVRWEGETAQVTRIGRRRQLRYPMAVDGQVVALGWFLLGSMRVERDFQYEQRHRRPFGDRPYLLPELTRLADAIESLPAAARGNHLSAVRARSLAALRGRFRPAIRLEQFGTRWTLRVDQPSLDGRDTLSLALRGDPRTTAPSLGGDSIVVRARDAGPIRLEVTIETTGPSLTPLSREEIFTRDFLAFADSIRAAGTRDARASLRASWMERQMRGVELLVSREKLMAGLPTYATYFGRDMLVSALMMRTIWNDDMASFAVAAALRKLSPSGEVSHEEALGGQAVREAASEYASLVEASRRARAEGNARRADSLVSRALVVLREHRRIRENYHMIDDELQLPILAAQWLADPDVPASRKRAFLLAVDDGGRAGAPPAARPATRSGDTRLARLLRELAQVARMSAPYAQSPSPATLIAFARRDDGRWASTSWRDSGAGYGNGRYAMDVNAIWAPHALQSIRVIMAQLRTLGFSPDSLARAHPEALGDTPLGRWTRDSASFSQAIETWLGAGRHFLVRLAPDEVRRATDARLAAMPEGERAHWRRVIESSGAARDSLAFLALALDSAGVPLGVVNSDVATRLFLGDPRHGAMDKSVVRRDARLFVRAYPVGLFIDGVGPVVANDAFAPPVVWQEFVRDAYHGPRVAWGREVNLFLLGVANQAARHADDPAFTAELREVARRVVGAVEASGFRSELWSYDFTGGAPRPVRYGSGADVQLWSTTDLAVQYALSRLRW